MNFIFRLQWCDPFLVQIWCIVRSFCENHMSVYFKFSFSYLFYMVRSWLRCFHLYGHNYGFTSSRFSYRGPFTTYIVLLFSNQKIIISFYYHFYIRGLLFWSLIYKFLTVVFPLYLFICVNVTIRNCEDRIIDYFFSSVFIVTPRCSGL